MKIDWHGRIVSIQPRTRVWRYITHNRTHYHIGYNLFIEDGFSGGGPGRFVVAISELQQQKNQFRIGDVVSGTAWEKEYPEREFADYYRAGSLKILKRFDGRYVPAPPPWIMAPPDMSVYEYRGARMLSKSSWAKKCFQCVWATMSNVEIQWDFDRRISKYRFESFCYGPKDCKYYKMGRPRTVPYKGMDSAIDDGWLDDLCTENREYDE